MVKPNYTFCVTAALQEELNAFYVALGDNYRKIELPGGVAKIQLQLKNATIDILAYSANKMGMPYNAAAITRIIMTYNPKYTFFIGTCAGLREKNNIGDVLVPDRVFTYESGKHENGEFLPDDLAYETGQTLRKAAEELKHNIGSALPYKVITDEDLCSGAAVINDPKIVQIILERSSRKVSGLDMESHALGCINQIFHPECEISVIKSIMDFAREKQESEDKGNKELAKKNAADFALRLIK
jgi:nucleoside phosphorylase